MRPNKIMILMIALSLFVPVMSVSAQDSEAPGADFGLGLLLGVETFDPVDGSTESETYQTLALSPDLALGDFGIGLDLVLHYRFVSPETNDGSSFDIREEDWIPMNGQTFLDLYLPKIKYIRYGYKGDALYAKFGQIEDATLGTGFIVNQYSNTLFQPDEKIMGLNFDLDGQIFNFPYLGIETFVGNLAHFDVFGGRLYARPLLWSAIPIIENLEWGITGVFDIDADYRTDYFDSTITGVTDAEMVLVYGTDLVLPIINLDFASLAVFGDLAFQGINSGSMVGFGGRLIGIIPYVFQLRFLGDNFIPSYFNNSYDLYRGIEYAVLNSGTSIVIPGSISWLGTTGVSLLDDQLVFTATLDGPFAAIPTDGIENNSFVEYPHVYAMFLVEEGLIPDFSLSASYDKKFITDIADLISAENALINMAINYNAGAAVITLSYDLMYISDGTAGLSWEDFDINSTLSCSLKLF
ncbi:MAG: hypothetical protein JEZ04_08855 [Spirochaetales bacterium]|nr:hypothetical protein [Spirochaetales bacterium]